MLFCLFHTNCYWNICGWGQDLNWLLWKRVVWISIAEKHHTMVSCWGRSQIRLQINSSISLELFIDDLFCLHSNLHFDEKLSTTCWWYSTGFTKFCQNQNCPQKNLKMFARMGTESKLSNVKLFKFWKLFLEMSFVHLMI